MSGFYSVHQVNGAGRGCMRKHHEGKSNMALMGNREYSGTAEAIRERARDWGEPWNSWIDLKESVNPLDRTIIKCELVCMGEMCDFLKKQSIAFIRKALGNLWLTTAKQKQKII